MWFDAAVCKEDYKLHTSQNPRVNMKNYKHYNKTGDHRFILCPCPAPKRLLTSSNWISRNDSSSIDAILHPEDGLLSPRLKYGQRTKGDVIPKPILSRNNCYCRCANKKLPRPTFLKRPNSCVSYDVSSKTGSAGVVDEDDLKRKSLLGCVCSKEPTDDPSHPNGPDALRPPVTRLGQSKSLPAEVGLEHSDQRRKSEEYRQMQEERFQENLQDFEDNERYQDLRKGLETVLETALETVDSGSKVDTILGTRRYGTETSASNYQVEGISESGVTRGGVTDDIGTHRYGTESSASHYQVEGISESGVTRRGVTVVPDEDIPTDEFPAYPEWSVPDFRREHYFETHDIGKLSEITGDVSKDRHQHVCVHQFKLNCRWLPVPLNKDAFGRSVCKICERPMEGSNINLSTAYLSSVGDSLSRSKLKNYAEAYKNGLSPTTINLGKGKSNIELMVDPSDVTKLSSYVSKSKKPVYCNSLALRHQKMRLV